MENTTESISDFSALLLLLLITLLVFFIALIEKVYIPYLEKKREEELRILLITDIPYRVIINNILIYIKFEFYNPRIYKGLYGESNFNNWCRFKELYGRFLMDKTNKIFLIWKSCRITKENFIPKKVENLRLHYVKSIKLPNSIKKLFIDNCNMSKDTKFNPFFRKGLINLTVISLKFCDYFINGNDLPKGLKKLKVHSCINFKFSNLPQSLNKLVIIKSINFIDNNLPKILTILNVAYCNSFIGNNLPKILKILRVLCCNNFIGNNLPKSLNHLQVKSCDNFIGNNLPENLNHLQVKYCDNFIGNNLPKNLKILQVYGCHNFIGNNLPKSLTTLEVFLCVNFIGNNGLQCYYQKT